MSQYDPQKHHRRSIRLKGHDYAGGGLYFVTLCAHREAGNIFADEAVKAGVEKCWQEIPRHFPKVEALDFVVMPDHVHGMIRMNGATEVKNLAPSPENGGRPRGTSRTLGSVIRGFKIGVSKWVRQRRGEIFFAGTAPVWHRNYYEMIVRSAEAERKIVEYIRMNPWRCVQQLGDGLRGMGNPALWNAKKLGILISRNAPPPKSIPGAAVYLSGFHSPMEQEVFSRLLEHDRNIIWCPAWELGRAASAPGVCDALEQNRMLILEMRDTAGNLAAAEARNRFVIQHADKLFVPCKTPGGMLDRLLKEMKR